jgi:putative PIN family toxin of toxin-antitoxin system
VLSEAVFGEIAEVLSRPKFTRYPTEDRRSEALELLAAAARWVDPAERVEDCRDAKDNRYLELALAARAAAIVSGDEDLLVLNPWRGVRVLRPAQLLRELEPDGAVKRRLRTARTGLGSIQRTRHVGRARCARALRAIHCNCQHSVRQVLIASIKIARIGASREYESTGMAISVRERFRTIVRFTSENISFANPRHQR